MLHCYIIIPYRARGNQLERKKQFEYLIPYMNGYMKQFNINYTLMVIEQNDDKLFNRGKLFNIGVLEAIKLFNPQEKSYFCHQNVDIIPQKIDYSMWSEGITDVIGFDSGLGAMYFTDLESYVRINGYPNDYDGYGQDDIILLERCKYNFVNVNLSLKKKIADHTDEVYKKNNKLGDILASDPILKELHVLDIGAFYYEWRDQRMNSINAEKVKKEIAQPQSYITNGLNTCKYKVDLFGEINYKHYLVSWN
jgi:hypothetical protein